MNGLRFYIRHPDGRNETMVIDSDRVLVGAGAHCEIRLPVDQASVEHVALQVSAGGVHAQARAFSPYPTINGAPFTQAPLAPGSVLGVGQVQITVEAIEISEGAAIAAAKKQKTSPMTYILAAVAIPLSLFVLLSEDDDKLVTKPPDKYPELWDSPVTACPHSSPDQALAVASDKVAVAAAKRERRPFRVQDGVAAVPLYELAAACFRTAGQGEAAKESNEAAQNLRNQISEDYRTHRVRLEHALAINDLPAAYKETRVLVALTDGKQGEYVTWLSNLDRRLQLKVGSGSGRKSQ